MVEWWVTRAVGRSISKRKPLSTALVIMHHQALHCDSTFRLTTRVILLHCHPTRCRSLDMSIRSRRPSSASNVLTVSLCQHLYPLGLEIHLYILDPVTADHHSPVSFVIPRSDPTPDLQTGSSFVHAAPIQQRIIRQPPCTSEIHNNAVVEQVPLTLIFQSPLRTSSC